MTRKILLLTAFALFGLAGLFSTSATPALFVAPPSKHPVKISIVPKSEQSTLLDIYKTMDETILRSGDSNRIKTYLIEKNKEVYAYLQTNYPQLGSLDGIDVNDENFAIFGLVYALAERGGYLQPSDVGRQQVPEWLQCVGDVLGVTAIVGLIEGAATATYASVWVIVRKLVLRYVGWIGVGIALWEISNDCF